MNHRAPKPIFVDWCPKDALDGTQMLKPWEELAYRRLLDLIYATDDSLPDDDKRLAWMTKTGNRWKGIKAALIDMGKITVVEGRITNARCQKTLEKTRLKIAQKSEAGKASAEARKLLKEKETSAAGAATDVRTTRARVTQEPKSPNKNPPKPPKGDELAGEFEVFWQKVPRVAAKGQAERAYRTARKIASANTLLAGIERYARQVAADGTEERFIKHPATWLNGKCWLDEDSPPRARAGAAGGGSRAGGTPPGSGGGDQEGKWRILVQHWRDTGIWLAGGPSPGEPGCRAPDWVIGEILGAGACGDQRPAVVREAAE